MATCQELEEGEYSDCQSDDLFLQASQMYDESLTDVSNDADDLLLLQASQIYEDSLLDADPSHPNFEAGGTVESSSTVSNTRFAKPVSDEEIRSRITTAIPRSTAKTTSWAVRLWNLWAQSRAMEDGATPPPLDQITNDSLNFWLSRFVMEIRNEQGEEYQSGTLYSVCAGIQRYIREKRLAFDIAEPLDIYKDHHFNLFRSSLDSVLKDLHKRGIGNVKKQADVISEELEEKLWNDKLLGDDSPKKLQNTLIFCLGLNLALRSGQEHRRLRPDMFQIFERECAKPFLLYSESGSKNNQGGLNHRKVLNKRVKIFANLCNPARCIVRLFKMFMSLRPANAPSNALYLQPLATPLESCWYQARPMGHNALAMTVKTLCQSTGASGYYTNHSLRRTCASRLYNKGADEQEIMSVTGHRSSNAVRLYKKPSLEQEEKLSNMLKSGGSATSDSKVNDDAIVDKTKQPQPGLPVSLPQLPGFTGLSQCTINFSFNNYSNK